MHHNGMAASGAGWVLHDLGLAAAFGGSLFGKLAMNPAVRSIHSEEERSLVLTKAWTGYNIVNAASLATAAATWVVGRTMLSGREVSFMTRPLVIAKDVLLGVTVGTGVANIIADIVKAKTEPAAPMQSGEKPSQRTPETTRKLQTVWKVLGTVNLISMAGVIGVTAVLATQSAKSVRWGLLSRFLP